MKGREEQGKGGRGRRQEEICCTSLDIPQQLGNGRDVRYFIQEHLSEFAAAISESHSV